MHTGVRREGEATHTSPLSQCSFKRIKMEENTAMFQILIITRSSGKN
jgi:hypothetical protein